MAATGLTAAKGCLCNQDPTFRRALSLRSVLSSGCAFQLCPSPGLPVRTQSAKFSIHGSRVGFPARCVLEAAAEQPPSSRQDAVQQAGASLAALLEKSLKRQGALVKQRKDQKQLRLRVEIPVLDESPSSLFALSLDLLSAFVSGKKGLVTDIAVCFRDASLVELGRKEHSHPPAVPRLHFLDIGEAATVPKECSCLFVVAPSLMNAPAVGAIAAQAGVRPLVVVNPEWPEEEEGYEACKALMSSFEVAYSFTAICIQGMFQKTEGAILKHVKSGAPSGRPWLLFVKEGDKHKCIASFKRRPEASELQSSLYNFIAANSPNYEICRFPERVADEAIMIHSFPAVNMRFPPSYNTSVFDILNSATMPLVLPVSLV